MFYPVTGATALHRAAQRGDEAEVAALLDQVRISLPPAAWLLWVAPACFPVRLIACCIVVRLRCAVAN